MPVEWIAISAALVPFLKRYAADRATKLAAGKLDDAFRLLLPDTKIHKINDAFVTRFRKELDSAMDLPTLQADSYWLALTEFLRNWSVQDLLAQPLDGRSELAWEVLRGIWGETRLDGVRLIALPEGFSWARVAKRYGESVRTQALADEELRPVVQALAQLRTAEAAEESRDALVRMAPGKRVFDLERYADDVRKAFAHLKLGSIHSEWVQYESRVRLENVYVPQSAKRALPPRDLTRDYRKRLREEGREHGLEADEAEAERMRQEYAEVPVRPILEVVDDPHNRLLVILGDPGSGKSTLLRLLALRWTENSSKNPLMLFLELRRAADVASKKGFLEYLEQGAGECCGLPRRELEEMLRSEESLVLFDGLDEVAAGKREDVVGRLIQFAGDFPRARVMVTTRIHGYRYGSKHPEKFRDAGFQQHTLQDFEEPEIERFIERWHLEAFAPGDHERYAGRLRKAIADSPAIRELAANPLLLTMMAILSRVQDLPRDRVDFYAKCAELLLKSWDSEKFPELKEQFGPKQKMRILECVAEAMQRERTGLEGNLISQDKLERIVTEELEVLGVPQAWRAAEELIRLLRERNFMLGYRGDGQYAFVHRTFLEYFCARELAYRLQETSSLPLDELQKLFAERWREDAWQEPLRLLCGLIGVEFAEACIRELAEQRGDEDGENAVFLAAQCLREIREVGRIRGVRDLVRERLLELTRFDLLFHHEPWDEDGRHVAGVRSQAVQELARGWKEDPETRPLLLDRAAHDEHWSVRQAAVQELARGWKEDPETRPWLLDRATHDEHWRIRRAAVQELARGWKEDPETRPWLLDRAAHDEDWIVRRAAVRELQRGWGDDPEVKALVAGLGE